jgi:transcriptional regulator with XRE-family HTH domain
MKNRILEFLKVENKSSAQFADEIGVQASSISHIISGRNNPSLDFVMKMLQKYPALSTDWLLFGKGDMYKEARFNGLFDERNDRADPSADFSENKPKGSLEDQKAVMDSNSAQIVERKTLLPGKMAKRIVVIYYDDTFKELLPGVE